MAPCLIARRIDHSLTNDIRRRNRCRRYRQLINYPFYNVHRIQLLRYSVKVSSLYQLEIGLAILRRRLKLSLYLGIWCELVEPSDGARRLLVGRLELLPLGGVLVDLSKELVPLRYQLFDTTSDLVFHF